jgi:2-oxoglutarate dehydrogenase E2 component (dihydrolipoamide succinyltransferase)
MSTSVTLPALGESVTEGTVSRWLKQVGDTVEADEPLLEVSTDKVDTEIPSPTSGVLLEIRAQEDETVEVGAVLAVIGDASEQSGGSDAAPEEPQGAEDEGSNDQVEAEPEPEPDPTSAVDADKVQEAEPSGDSGGSSEAAAPSSGGAASGTDVTLPALGESVTEGTVSRWLKAVGDAVEADEPLLEVSTDKVDTEIPVAGPPAPCWRSGCRRTRPVEVGAVLAVVGDQSAQPGRGRAGTGQGPGGGGPRARDGDPRRAAREISEQTAAGDEGGQAPIPGPRRGAEAGGQGRSAARTARPHADREVGHPPWPRTPTPVTSPPLVRKLAKEHGVDLAAITGTGSRRAGS